MQKTAYEMRISDWSSDVCSSDLAKALGLGDTGAVIAGHEPCGVVVAVGAGVAEKEARIGQRVMVHHYRGCGVCPHCATGWMQLCNEGVAEVYGVTGHGAHAPYMKVPARTLVTLPDSLSFATGAPIAFGPGTPWGTLQRLEFRGDPT